MSNFGPYYAKFYNKNLELLYNDNGVLSTTSGTSVFQVSRAKSAIHWKKIGYGSFYVPPHDLMGWPIVWVGHIAIVYQYDAIAGANMVVCPPFEIRTIQIDVESQDVPMYEISGPDMAQEFADWSLWEDVGAQEFGHTTFLHVRGVGRTYGKVYDSATIGNFDDGDSLKIYDPSNGQVLFRGTQVGSMSPVTSPDGWEFNWTPPLYNEVPEDADVVATDYRTPATDDIDQIITELKQYLLWTLTVEGGGSGTQAGTSHAATGQSVLSALNSAAAISNEWWRLGNRANGAAAPTRELEWRQTSDSSAIKLVMPDQAAAATDYANTSRGIIEGFTRDYHDERVSHLVATCGGSGDKKITLADATNSPSTGFTLIQDNERGTATLKKNSVASDLDADGVYAYRTKVIDFSNISPSGSSAEAKVTAANQLLAAAENWLTQQEEKYRFYRVTAVIHKDLQIGQTIELEYSNNEWFIDATGVNKLYIVDIKIIGGTNGVRKYDLLLGERLQPREDGISKLVSGAGATAQAVGILGANAAGLGGGGDEGETHTPVTIESSSPAGALTIDGQALTFDDSDISGATPGTVSSTTTNLESGGVHYHEVEAYSDAYTNKGELVETDQYGNLRLNMLGVGSTTANTYGLLRVATRIELQSGGNITTFGSGDIDIDPDVDLNLIPTNDLYINPGGQFLVDNNLRFVSARSINSNATLTISPSGSLDIEPTVDANLTPTGDLVVTAGSQFIVNNDLEFVGARDITSDSAMSITPTALTLNPSGNIAIDAGGSLTVDNNIEFQGAQSISSTSGDIGIYPTADLILAPAGQDVMIGEGASNPRLRADAWTSGFLGVGWGLTHEGHLDVRSIYTEELRATLFTVEHSRVLNGGEWITPSASELTSDFTIPAVSSSTTITVNDLPGLSGIPVFGENDYVLMLYKSISAGITISKTWGQVSGWSDNGDGTQDWTFTTRSATTTGVTMEHGAAIVSFGQSGDGGIFLNAMDLAGNPYIDMFRWYDNPYTPGNLVHPLRLGDLGGTGATEKGVMGLFVGDVSGKYLLATETSFEAHGLGLSLYSDGGNTGTMRLNAIEVTVDMDVATYTLRPNADVSSSGVSLSAGSVLYSLIDDDPDSVDTGDYVRNQNGVNGDFIVDLTNILQYETANYILIKAHITAATGTAKIRLMAEILDSSNEPLTDMVELANEDDSTGLVSKYAKVISEQVENDWDNARLHVFWLNQPSGVTSEVIRLDPTIPSIAVGSNDLPTGLTTPTNGDGFWVGDVSGTTMMRVGLAAGPQLRWDGTNVTLRNSSDAAVIALKSNGDSYFTGVMTIDTDGEIRQGTGTVGSNFTGLRIYNSSSIGTIEGYYSDDWLVRIDGDGISLPVDSTFPYFNDRKAVTFLDGTSEVMGLYAYDSGTTYSFDLSTPGTPPSGHNTSMNLRMEAASTYTASVIISALGDGGGSSTQSINLIAANDSGDGITYSADKHTFNSGILTASAGISVPSDGIIIGQNTPKNLQFTIDQAANDYEAILLLSSDVAHGVSTGTDISTDTYGSFGKVSDTAGGLLINGLRESGAALVLTGFVPTASTDAPSTSTRGIVHITGYEGTTPGNPGSSDNVFTIAAGTTAMFVMEGDGTISLNATSTNNAYDDHDDVALLRALSYELSPEQVIRNEFDAFVAANRQSLEAAGVINENGFLTLQNMLYLLSGATWQMHSRVARLEQQGVRGRIRRWLKRN